MREKRPELLCASGLAAKELRKGLGLNQTAFWARVGVVQTGGSRYESGRAMPQQVAWALRLSYGTPAQARALLEWLRRPQAD
jgi:DNA-binding transcriptional regulator YiaG